MKQREIKDCHDCGAKPGEMHIPGCDTERCPRCGMQAISCGCIYEVNGMNRNMLEEEHPDIYNNGATEAMCEKFDAEWGSRRQPWTGIWPGVEECRENDLWCKMVDGKGWVQCSKDDPDASEDLNRLVMVCEWDVNLQKFVRR